MTRPSPWTTLFAKRTYAGVAFWAAGMAADLLSGVPHEPGWLRIRLDLAGILYLGASVIGGSNFFRAGIRSARHLKLDMNFLMSSAIVAAILIGEPFEAATLAALFSLAELLERFAVDRSRRSVEKLLEMAPETAELVRPDGTTETVAAQALNVGQRIRIRPGSRIAADGRVVEGSSAVNEAAVTGESVPVSKEAGDVVYSGSLNTEGALDVEVTADAAHSVLARIVELVRAAEQRRAPIEHFVQRFSRIYTPAVTALAVLVIAIPPLAGMGPALMWFVRGITLLVIACPCALVIATPVTVVSALTGAARHGVLIKGGQHLEQLGAVRALATDKTGTLTAGELEVTSLRVRPDSARDDMLRLLTSVESRSEHPIAKAIVRFAEREGMRSGSVTQFQALPGKGLVGKVDNVTVTVGTEALVADTAQWGALDPGAISVFAATDHGMSARVDLADTARPEALVFVRRLHALGVRPVVLLTGDQRGPAEAVGKAVGVDVVRARLLPEEKVQAVQELRAEHRGVAMVGDGINDAPALAEASVGIAMGTAGSPAAIETADVALMADDLTRVPYAIELARRARRTIRFNIAVALGLKLALAVGAILGVVTLAVAVLVGDMGGSLLVTGNALRLAHLHPPDAHTHQDGTRQPT